jgi:Sec-independent protein translocase protein TatA
MPIDIAILLIIVLIVVLIWRGPKTLPKIGQAAGKGVKAVRDEANVVLSEDSEEKR